MFTIAVATLMAAVATAPADTIEWDDEPEVLNEVTVTARRKGITRVRGAEDGFVIGRAELTRAACCNLGESFETNAAVDVAESDATTGARQIKLLGLAGTYVQMLTENVPNYRGATRPYALGYVPGPWIQSIQVSKGNASVKNGYESLTGQINMEFLKPSEEEQVNLNLFGSTETQAEANLDANLHVTDRTSTGLLVHWQDMFRHADSDGDGFADMPDTRQYHVMNRWSYLGERYSLFAGASFLHEKRTSGQIHHSAPETFDIANRSRRYQGFLKNAYTLSQTHHTSLALMLSASWHDMDARWGRKQYDVLQRNLYGALFLETGPAQGHALSTGLSVVADHLIQHLRLSHAPASPLRPVTQRETVPGAYAQYTFTVPGKLTLMGGVRSDRSSVNGWFVTPRVNARYVPVEGLTLRASAGKGYRTVFPYAEYNYLLAVGRPLVVDTDLPREDAANYGASASWMTTLWGHTLTVNADYYYTRFRRQVIVDRDTDPDVIHITSLHGRSYSHTLQADITYEPFEGLSATVAFRYNDVRTTYGNRLLATPLTPRYRGLLTASYKTPLELWQFDATLNLTGPSRLPMSDTTTRPYLGLSALVTRYFRHFSLYAGGENLTGYRQDHPILGADDPWGSSFDPTIIYAPTTGAMGYVGIRYNFSL